MVVRRIVEIRHPHARIVRRFRQQLTLCCMLPRLLHHKDRFLPSLYGLCMYWTYLPFPQVRGISAYMPLRRSLLLLLLLLAAASVGTERPDREDVAVLRVGDSARTVEDARDALLWPVASARPRLHLPIHEELFLLEVEAPMLWERGDSNQYGDLRSVLWT